MVDVLVIVDVQNDFCEGGALAVEGGNEVAHQISRYVAAYGDTYDLIFATRDWHRPLPDTNGGHFSDEPNYRSTWPVHCVQWTGGAEYHPWLSLPERTIHVTKGDGRVDYSAAEAVIPYIDELTVNLVHEQVFVDVVGLAFDYCVKSTALDLAERYHEVNVLADLTAAVHKDDKSVMRNLVQLSDAGVNVFVASDRVEY